MRAAPILLALAGCASAPTAWDKPGATPSDLMMDDGQCQAQAASAVAGATGYLAPFNARNIYKFCMQGKGWMPQQ